MKFSDMMGKRDRDTTEVTEPQLPPEAATAPPLPEAPIRFGESRTAFEDATAAVGGGTITPPRPPVSPLVSAAAAPPAPPETATAPPAPETVAAAPPVTTEAPRLLEPSRSEVVAELAPRPAVAAVTDQQLDASAWLDDIASIDDDLLPR
jgi:hypothetical protein